MEKRKFRTSCSTLPSTKIETLAACHPFSQKLDIVFPSNPSLTEILEKLETCYGKAKISLSDLAERAATPVGNGQNKNLLVVSNSREDDAWCIDSRGYLTISVKGNTYERLGLVGRKLPFKNAAERHVIESSLQTSSAIRAKLKARLEVWDKIRRDEIGPEAGLWDVLYGSDGTQQDSLLQGSSHPVKCRKKERKNIFVPTPSLSARPERKSGKGSKQAEEESEELHDWNLRIENLFEWVGMACLGAQRLNANDRVDPYLAVYEPPDPSIPGNVTHLQWRGFLTPNFIQKAIDIILANLQMQDCISQIPFVGISCHALTASPVSYIPYTLSASGALQTPVDAPIKIPREEAEDTWSLILEKPARLGESIHWCLAECIGQWDSRWG